MPFTKMGTFTFDHTNQQDGLYKAKSAAEIKAAFDSRGNELKTTINNLIDSLQAITDGASGADAIGVTPISTSPSTLQGTLEWLQAQIAATTLGQIPDGSITEAKLNFDPATQIELNNHKLEDATLTTKGHVQLSSSTTSTNETTAATSKAVKDAITDAKGASIPLSQKAAASGVASLDAIAKVQLNQMNNTIANGVSTLTYTQNGTTTTSQQLNLGTDFDRIDMLLGDSPTSTASKLVTVFKNGDIIYQPSNNSNAVMLSKADMNPSATPSDINKIFLAFGDSMRLSNITYSNGILTFYVYCDYASGSHTGALKIKWFAK